MVGYPGDVFTWPDQVAFDRDAVVWYHRNNNDDLVYDKDVRTQGLEKVKDRIPNPLKDLTFGGLLAGDEMQPAGTATGRYIDTDFSAWRLRSRSPRKSHRLTVSLHTAQTPTVEAWRDELAKLAAAAGPGRDEAWKKHQTWWRRFWQRSAIFINPQAGEKDVGWQVGRNYQLFRYMLGCNAYGEYPTKFNGSLFTFDPGLMGGNYGRKETPDYRMWGGGSFTAQNQRLVYWPMLKSGDFDMMIPQFEFYRRALPAAEARTRVYWGHEGCSFTEQIEQFGLPIGSHYGWPGSRIRRRRRPDDFEPGVQVNTSCRYEFVHQLDFAFMILQYHRSSGKDIAAFMPFIDSSVTFFDRHYQFRARQRTGKPLDDAGHLVIYPSTGAETYVGARNPTDAIAGLKAVLSRLVELPERYVPATKRRQYKAMLGRVPPLPMTTKQGRRVIAPAESWERYQCGELTMLYPVFPFELYGIGRPDLPLAVDTWQTAPSSRREKDFICWAPGNIMTARLGLTAEAKDYAIKKFTCKSRRFGAFFEVTDYDQIPDVDHGGTGMIGLQDMLLQPVGKKLHLLPSWPPDWDVDFKLHAPRQTTVEAKVRGGKVQQLTVTPPARRNDVILPAGK